MRLIDANILIYAYDVNSPYSTICREWLDNHLNGIYKLGLPWHSLLAFTRIVTNPRIYEQPVFAEEAWEQVGEWLALETSFIPQPGPNHYRLISELLSTMSHKSNDIPDLHLVALCMEHGLIMCSTDADFLRNRELRVENPLRP